jgi:phenylpropionate dioxygenase-like ring-hydroxylating dioxygenase large terminal subunit
MALIMNAWYVAAWPNEITADAILARTICNRKIVLWRKQDGSVAALEDRCCHREMPLSLGRLEQGTIRCGYHGLRFDATGACVEIPGQDRIPATVVVDPVPVIQKHGWVYVWPGDASKADPALIPQIHERNDHPDWASAGGTTYVESNYQLISDNLLDLTHETYIHATSLGNQAVVENPMETRVNGDQVTVERWMINHDPAPFWKGAIKRAHNYDGMCDRWQIVNFVPPANIVLDVGVAPTGTGAPEGDRSKGVPGCNLNAITPETETSTWYFWAFSRKFQLDDPDLGKQMAGRVASIFEEDKVAVEAVQKIMDSNPGRRWVNLSTDAGGMAARRIVERHVEMEQKAQAAE